jgi:hypothetical protein
MLNARKYFEAYWRSRARDLAKLAFEKWFHSRRGVWYEDDEVLCVYNNNPYANDSKLRDKETAKFRGWLKQNGIKERAYATYPETGEDAGYTYAMLLKVSNDRRQDIVDVLNDIHMESMERLARYEQEAK